MKKIFVLLTSLLLLSFITKAQMMKKQEWVTIKSANLRCWECKEILEKYLTVENKGSMESGIIQWKINMLQGEIRLQFWPDRTNPDVIRTAMNNVGFDADTAKAEPFAYKKLPPICKRIEEGGGPQKGKPCHLQPLF